MSKGHFKALKKEDTPLMRQYNGFKEKYPGAVLLFRVGDFYETFGEDAVCAARILGIVLTKRGNGSATEVELAGFPYHQLDNYLPKLVRAGQRVVVCDQLEDAALAKGIVKRGVTEIATPGIALGDRMLDVSKYNYLAAIHFESHKSVSVAFLEVSTGDFFCWAGSLEGVEKLMGTMRPSEVVVSRKDLTVFKSVFGEDFYVYRMENWAFENKTSYEALLQHFSVHSLKGFGMDDEALAVVPAGVLLQYLKLNEHHNIAHINKIYLFEDGQFVGLDRFTVRNLELVNPLFKEGKTLAEVLDYTQTPMGSRLLRRWILFPLRDRSKILSRQSKIKTLVEDKELLAKLNELLKGVGDMERLSARLAMRKILPRECGYLRNSLSKIKPITTLLKEQNTVGFTDFLDREADIKEPLKLLKEYLMDDCTNTIGTGKVIGRGVSKELDEMRDIQKDARKHLEDFQHREIALTGITTLRVDFNKVFGYYIEISNAKASLVPSDYIRKQTLTNAERYITPELKVFEEKILGAAEKVNLLETELYASLLDKLQPYLFAIQTNAELLAELDVLSGLANCAEKNNYCCPEIGDENKTIIEGGRHAVIERLLPPENPYIPNDVSLDSNDNQILIVTGPNMAGKSALLRQTALIALLGQIGSFVPAKSAYLGLVDRIFTRVGASDNLSAGESTFMVEMNETARILNNATSRSLILLDEIGRGTSTYDGISIAWAIVEYLHNNQQAQAKTLFATHYHELAQLSEILPRVRNFNFSVKEIEGKIIFLRKLQEGSSEHSFGIQVAEMAGVPRQIVLRAKELLTYFEQNRSLNPSESALLEIKTPIFPQMRLFEIDDELTTKIRQLLENVDIDRITGVDALLKLREIQRLLGIK